MPAQNPTAITYTSLDDAFLFFNQMLFESQLPPCLITMQRHRTAYGFFSGGRFETRDHKQIADEIALNPSHFLGRTIQETLSTLVHEMTHLKQFHFGKPSRSGYHNRQWAGMMKSVGLIPSDTGEPGGTEIGQTVSHYIEKGGPFERACAKLMKQGVRLPYVETPTDETLREKKAASKTRYTCLYCQMNAWAKPNLHLICGDCEARMKPD